MHEIELKFQVPAAARAAVEVALHDEGAAEVPAETVRLAARYFDTAGRDLARAGFALRLRLEGECWVQTLKGRAPGRAGLIERLEHNVVLPEAAGGSATELPALDLQRHHGTPAGDALLALLAAAGARAADLQLQYETDIGRLLRRVRHRAALIELAFDRGEIRCGSARLAVCELELELLDGPREDLIDAARGWVRQHGVWLDVRSKAERGDRLARGEPAGRAVPPAAWPPGAALPERLGLVLASVLPNLADVAGETAGPGQLEALQQGAAALAAAWPAGAGTVGAAAPPTLLLQALADPAVAAQALRASPLQQAVLDWLAISLTR